MYEYSSSIEETSDILSQIYEMLGLGVGIAQLGLSGIIIMIAIISLIVSLIVSLIIYVIEALPIYTLAKKVGRQYAWLAWIPIFGSICRTFVLSDIAGDKEFVFFENNEKYQKYKFTNRFYAFGAYALIALFGGAIITVVISILAVIPIIGQILGAFTSLLYLLPKACEGLLEYAFLRDVLDMFKPDKKANRTAALIVTLLDCFVTFGIARGVYLITIMKADPLPAAKYAEEPIYTTEQ